MGGLTRLAGGPPRGFVGDETLITAVWFERCVV